MNDPVGCFKPEFLIDQSSPTRAIRVGLNIPPADGMRSKVRYVDAVLRGSEPIEVEVIPGDEASRFKINLNLFGAQGGEPIQIGELAFDSSISQDDVPNVAEKLTSIAQYAFFTALKGGVAPQHAPPQPQNSRVAQPDAEAAPGPARARRLSFRKGLVAAVVLAGVGLVVYGGLHSVSKPSDPVQDALNGDNYADLQQKIRQQFAKNAGEKSGTAYGALQGQNIAIDTMRAMGLDPGKANSGCLVGVKPK